MVLDHKPEYKEMAFTLSLAPSAHFDNTIRRTANGYITADGRFFTTRLRAEKWAETCSAMTDARNGVGMSPKFKSARDLLAYLNSN